MAPNTAPDPHALARRYEIAEPSNRNYDAICAAVMETARGRWFLAEYARRNRNADTEALLAVIVRVEASLAGAAPSPTFARMRDELRALVDTIRNARGKFGVSGREWVKTAQVMALLEQLQRCIENMIGNEGGVRQEPEENPEISGPAPTDPLPMPGRAHLTVVAPPDPPAEPPVVRGLTVSRMPEVSALEPEAAQPAAKVVSVTPSGSGTPALSELSTPFTETNFALPTAEIPEPAAARAQPPAAMLREFERLAAQEQDGEHAFVPFDDAPAERPLPQRPAKPAASEAPRPPPPPRLNAQPRPPGDPLQPIMALSEEERLALFT